MGTKTVEMGVERYFKKYKKACGLGTVWGMTKRREVEDETAWMKFKKGIPVYR